MLSEVLCFGKLFNSLFLFNIFRVNAEIDAWIGIFFYSYMHTMFGSFLPPSPTLSLNPPRPLLLPSTPSIPGKNYFALISNFVEERV
jgi:hypothetical protein